MGLGVELYMFDEPVRQFILLCCGYDDSDQSLFTLHNEALRLGLPLLSDADHYLGQLGDMGRLVDEPAIDYPKSTLRIGRWESTAMIRTLLKFLADSTIYDILPEAVGDPEWLLPNWRQACGRVQSTVTAVMALGRMPPQMISEGWTAHDFDEFVDDLHVIHATLRYPTHHRGKYLLWWSV